MLTPAALCRAQTSKPRTKRQQALAEARARPASSRAVPLPTPPAPLTPAQPVRSRVRHLEFLGAGSGL